jgi:predicted AlkP superfamily phosphohydrolase/phosphomutase/predicted Zn-dependent protease
MSSKVLLIGWDGADWKVIHPLLDAGVMPNLARLVNEGVSGNLMTLQPPLSPMLWTSIATGKRAHQHGILGFSEPDPVSGGLRPVSILSRKTRAIWNILQTQGLKSNVIGWWPSHPAEPISGVMVSEHFHRMRFKPGEPCPLAPGAIHPARLIEPLAEFRVHPSELMTEHIMHFVPRLAEVDQEKDHRIESLACIIAECTSIHAAATAVMQLEPWDFMAVYYDAIDHFGHAFQQYHPPRLPWIPEKDFAIYKDVVTNAYHYHDEMLGALLALAGADTTVLLVSDHGFHPDHLRPREFPLEPAGPAMQHRDHGIFVARGPRLKRDEVIHGATLLDIAPTLLMLYGLPVGDDMDGKPLVNIFAEPPPVQTIPTWDAVTGPDGTHPPETQLDPVEAQAAIDQLVALGYIARPPDDLAQARTEAVRELHYNLARDYIGAGRHADALPLLDAIAGRWPDEYRFSVLRVRCLQHLDRLTQARSALEELLARRERNAAAATDKLKQWLAAHPDAKFDELDDKTQFQLRQWQRETGANPYALHSLMGALLLDEGRETEALAHLEKAAQADAGQPGVHLQIGNVYLKMKRWTDAENAFQQTLRLDAESAGAHLGLCRAWLGQRRAYEAAGAALQAISLQYYEPLAHYLLGIALHRLGRIPRAVEALRVALAQNPNFVEAHERLAQIYQNRLKNPEAAAEHRRLAAEATQRIAALKAGQLPSKQRHASTARTSDQDVLTTPPDAGPVDLAETVTIVSGLPRSGTSLMMQMLQAGGLPSLTDGTRAADENNPRGYFEFEKAKQLPTDNSWLPSGKGRAVKIVAQLLRALPVTQEFRYRVIFMQRDLDEVIASQKKMLGQTETPANLARAFAAQLRQIQRVLAVRSIPALYIEYRQIIANPAAAAARVNAFLGGTLDERAMAAVVDPELYRNRS